VVVGSYRLDRRSNPESAKRRNRVIGGPRLKRAGKMLYPIARQQAARLANQPARIVSAAAAPCTDSEFDSTVFVGFKTVL